MFVLESDFYELCVEMACYLGNTTLVKCVAEFLKNVSSYKVFLRDVNRLTRTEIHGSVGGRLTLRSRIHM
jgi:hypothetical protein